MNIKDKLLLYAITERGSLNDSEFLFSIEQSLQGGVTMLQLREKTLHGAAFLNLGYQVKQLADRYAVPLIINDDVWAAAELDAAGVHLGQGDMDVAEARNLLGAKKIIGVTAKTMTQALIAESAGADYLGCGAVFSSMTKMEAKPMSLLLLQEICACTALPVCAIGGIRAENVHLLKNSGIVGIAVSKAIYGAEDIKLAGSELRKALSVICS